MKRTLLTPLVMIFALLVSTGSVFAQTQNQEGEAKMYKADPADVKSIDAIVAAVYEAISGEAGEERNWDRFRSLFHPKAMLVPTGVQNGQAGAFHMTPEEYIERSGPWLIENGFFEIEVHGVTEQFGHIAHHFSTYESRRTAADVEPFMRGINSIQLINDGERWWVLSIYWQHESEGYPLPDKYLPKG